MGDTDREYVLEYDDVHELPFADEQTPTQLETPGACWLCWAIMPVQIVSPAPGSSHEAMRFHTCIASAGGFWSWCASKMVLRIGQHELYLGPERRIQRLPPPSAERRRFPKLTPREDDK
jgi:hypothetical protein